MHTTEIAVKMILDRWNGSIANWNKHLNALSDERLMDEIAPGKNRGVYLLGHMVAVHDDMLRLLDLGEKQHPELYEPFLKNADKVTAQIPPVALLREYWTKQCAFLDEQFGQMQLNDWFEKHTAVSAEEFANEPHRNKLNIIVTRTSHLQYHTGQLVMLQ
ncbi:MAG: DinB family protein [Chitinophagaceae bacterium]